MEVEKIVSKLSESKREEYLEDFIISLGSNVMLKAVFQEKGFEHTTIQYQWLSYLQNKKSI